MKKISTSFLAIILLLSLSINAHATSFSGFYNGNMDDADADLWVSKMGNLGYSQTRYKTTHASTSTGKPTASDILAADDSDFVYISGHGMKDTELWINKDNSSTLTDLAGAVSAEFDANNSYTDPYSNKAYNSTTEINTAFMNTYTTYSVYDYNIEWLTIAGCSQLNYGSQGLGNFWNNINSSQIWARTMLGSNRLHGIHGYYGSAPGDSHDVDIVDDYFDEAYDDGWYDVAADTLIEAWKDSNNQFLVDISWAQIVHRGNDDDYLPGQKTGLTADTTGAYDIDLYQLNQTQLDLNLSSADSNYYLANKPSNAIPSNISSEKTTFNILSTVDPIQKNLGSLEVTPWNVNRKDIANQLITGDIRELHKDGFYTLTNKDKIAKIYDNGLVKYDTNVQLSALTPVSFGQKDAVQKAKDFLNQHGLLPTDAKIKSVSNITRRTMTPETEDFGNETVVGYTISFEHLYNGTEISSIDGEGIKVVVNEDGIESFRHLWHDIIPSEQYSVSQPFIDYQIALNSFENVVDRIWNFGPEAHITDISLVYYSPNSNQKLIKEFKPAWKIEINHNIPILIDSSSGNSLQVN